MTALAHAALAYARRGWHVFPLRPRTKEPLTGSAGFHDATSDVATVRAWWTENPSRNIGLWPGPSGLLVIDIDGPTGEVTAHAMGVAEVATLVVSTGRREGGRHLYFHRPPFAVGNVTLGAHLEIRCDNGYVVLPPSVHPSGTTYRWQCRWKDLVDIPRTTVEKLRQLHRVSEDVRSPLSLPSVVGDLDRRVQAYLDAVGNRGQGERNNTAFRVAAWLVNDMSLSKDAAWAWLESWNTKNVPPLAMRELRACLHSAGRSATHPKGAGLAREASSAAPNVASRDPFAGRRLMEAAL